MNFKSVFHQLAHKCGVCLTLLIAVAILVPGCAGKRPELLSSLIPQKSAADDEDSAGADVSDPVAAAGLIAEAETTRTKSRLSAFTEDEIIEGPPRLLKRLRNRFRHQEDLVVTSDPFIGDDAVQTTTPKAKADLPAAKSRSTAAKSDGPTVEELLASFESKRAETPTAQSDAWWMTDVKKNGSTSSDAKSSRSTAKPASPATSLSQDDTKLAEEFDSRLDRLRSELAGAETMAKNAALHADKVEENPFAAAETKLASTPSSLLTKPVEQLRNSTSADNLDSLTKEVSLTQTSTGTASQRIKAMLADARRDRENWNLRRAYRTALDAQELAVLENVQFAADDVRPQQLADEIADDLRRDVIRPESSRHEIVNKEVATSDVNPFAGESDPLEKAVSSRFGFPEFSATANPWTTTTSGSSELPKASSEIEIVAESGSRTSGVSLLPPADDFPSDAARSEWGLGMSTSNPIRSSSEEEEIQLTTHKSPEFTLTRDAQPRDQLPGLSGKDNKALLTTVAEQRSRVLESKSVEWPTLSAPNVKADEPIVKREPIRIAKAPRFALDDDAAAAPIVPKSTSSQAPAAGSLLGQFWRSQPVWFIGGLLLLIVALRLLPWPRRGTE